MKQNFAIGDRVEDTDSHRAGVVVHLYGHEEIRDELIAVRFDDYPVPLAVHVDDMRRIGKSRRKSP
jgi:hypothetical protein